STQLIDEKGSIVDNISNSSAISEELSAATEEIYASTSELAASSTEVAVASDKVHDLTTEILKKLSTFKVK
ncbi:MAG: methyl-accepting chemotaxis protein, partial [Clostridium sp.]